jgi:hypothetical protein
VRDYHLDFMKFRLNVVPGLNVGVADLIRSGKVKIKQGVEIARFTENSAVFTDGSSLEIDAVVFAYVLFASCLVGPNYRSEHPTRTSAIPCEDYSATLSSNKPARFGELTRRAKLTGVIVPPGIQV